MSKIEKPKYFSINTFVLEKIILIVLNLIPTNKNDLYFKTCEKLFVTLCLELQKKNVRKITIKLLLI
jgi:hypothetical protein